MVGQGFPGLARSWFCVLSVLGKTVSLFLHVRGDGAVGRGDPMTQIAGAGGEIGVSAALLREARGQILKGRLGIPSPRGPESSR